MSRISELDQELRSSSKPIACKICRFLAGMSGEERAELEHLLGRNDDGTWRRSHSHMAKLISQLGAPVSDSSVHRHRTCHV
jgi:hypothetical protein